MLSRLMSVAGTCRVWSSAGALLLIGCQSAPVPNPNQPVQAAANPSVETAAAADPKAVRSTGTIRAINEHVVLVPRIRGASSRMTLVGLIPNGATVEKGDIVAEFDRTQQLDQAREALAKYEDFSHRVEQKKAENRANTEKRAEEMEQARAALAKAEIQRRIAPVLAEIERLQNEVRLKDATEQVASLEKSHQSHEIADAAALRILELQMERERINLERAERNSERLVVQAPLAGMVAHENVWRAGSRGPPQIGDQMYNGRPLLRIFDPNEMEVLTQVGEPDGAVLVPGARALVSLDAYPEMLFHAKLHSASPVAAAAVGSPLRKFSARFTLLETGNQYLLPDLSAAVLIQPPPEGASQP